MSMDKDERNYRDFSNIIKEIVSQRNRPYISGKIVGYIDDKNYKVALANGKYGVLQCDVLENKVMVQDYRNKEFCRYNFLEERNTKYDLLKKVNQIYYFEIVEESKTDDKFLPLSIKNVREDYLDYVIKNKSIIKGIIIQIESDWVVIEIPFGIVLRHNKRNIFGCECASKFLYSNFLEAEISVIIEYNEVANLFISKCANIEYSIIENDNCYMFPVLNIFNGLYTSKLWLDKKLDFKKSDKKFHIGMINQLFLVQHIRVKGSNSIKYIANVRKIFSEQDAKEYRRNILAVGWIKDLKNYKVQDAVHYLESRGFTYSVRFCHDTCHEYGIVIKMQPDIQVKRIVPRNLVIILTISQGMRRSYILEDFIGQYAGNVKKNLTNKGIKLKYETSHEKIEGIEENCVVKTLPTSGREVHEGEKVIVTIYQEKEYTSPFILRAVELTKIERYSDIIGTLDKLNEIYSTYWKKCVIKFLLKHKTVSILQIHNWMKIYVDEDISEYKIKGLVKLLKQISMVGTVFPNSDILDKASIYFQIPLENLYVRDKEVCRKTYNELCYNGRISTWGKDMRFFKIRGAENQAFLKLYSFLVKDFIIEYEVDCIQKYVLEGIQGVIKMHIVVNAKSKLSAEYRIYFIESIRFLCDEHIEDGWKKIKRYNYFLNNLEVNKKIFLILVFEDENHYHNFWLRKPFDLDIKYMKIIYTWDQLTNMKSDNFENIFRRI